MSGFNSIYGICSIFSYAGTYIPNQTCTALYSVQVTVFYYGLKSTYSRGFMVRHRIYSRVSINISDFSLYLSVKPFSGLILPMQPWQSAFRHFLPGTFLVHKISLFNYINLSISACFSLYLPSTLSLCIYIPDQPEPRWGLIQCVRAWRSASSSPSPRTPAPSSADPIWSKVAIIERVIGYKKQWSSIRHSED